MGVANYLSTDGPDDINAIAGNGFTLPPLPKMFVPSGDFLEGRKP